MYTLSDHVAHATALLKKYRPLLQVETHLIASALFPILVGSYASLSRPTSAAKPAKKAKKSRRDGGDDDEDDDDDDEDELVQKMEGLSPRDAVVFPVVAGTVLAGLYWLIKRYGADAINLVLGWYFSFAGLFSLSKGFNDVMVLGLGVVFPTYFTRGGKVWKVDERKSRIVDVQDGDEAGCSSPLPGWLGGVRLGERGESWLWALRRLPKQKYDVVLKVGREVLDIDWDLTLINVLAIFGGVGAIAYNHYVDKPWWLTNLQGFSVSYTTLQFMSPTTFATGSLILSGLFFYDIWAVFFTPLMVTVATNLHQPIKLLFPKPDLPTEAGKAPAPRSYSMLGLGDIVLPGLMIGLALRFDLYMYYQRNQQRKIIPADASGEKSDDKENVQSKEGVVKAEYTTATGHWGSRFWTMGVPTNVLPAPLAAAAFPKPYFTAAMVGYVVGMLFTVGVMQVFKHAQPALLYLVPGVLVSLWGTALVRGEVKDMWEYSEVSDEEDEGGKKKREAQETKEKEDEEERKQARLARGQTGWLWDSRVWAFGEPALQRDESKDDSNEDGRDKDAKASKETRVGGKTAKKSKAEEDPNHVFLFSIRKHKRSKKSRTEKQDEVETEAQARSSSDDAVLVSKDTAGPATKSRKRGGAKEAKVV